MNSEERSTLAHTTAPHIVERLLGILVLLTGALALLDQYLNTGWLALVIPAASGLVFLGLGIFTRRIGLIIPGGIITGLGAGAFVFASQRFSLTVFQRIGALLVLFGLGWALIFILGYTVKRQLLWWSLIPAAVIIGLGIVVAREPFQPLDFALYPVLLLGLVFILWGLSAHLIGLIIPGSLLLGIGPGIYLGWSRPLGNPLAQTGVMLVIFALGWLLITVISRLIKDKFVWWPLIPGGIMAMTGWGLYIGGNPGNALSFISNTGSVGLVLFGIYLLLWRSSLRK